METNRSAKYTRSPSHKYMLVYLSLLDAYATLIPNRKGFNNNNKTINFSYRVKIGGIGQRGFKGPNLLYSHYLTAP